MSFAFGADPNLIVTGISAVLQAAQTWMAYRDSRRAREVFQVRMQQGVNTPVLRAAVNQLITLAPPTVVSSLGRRVEKCWTRYDEVLNAPDGTYLPQEIDDATEAVRRCVCIELKRLHRVNGSLPPGQFQQWWNKYGCR
jgi:hypothetical protein